MNTDKEHIDNIVVETLNSFNNTERATPKPFLYARIDARLRRTEESMWEKTSSLISRPAIAFAGLSLVIALNVFAIRRSTIHPFAQQLQQGAVDEFTTAVPTIYNIENTQP